MPGRNFATLGGTLNGAEAGAVLDVVAAVFPYRQAPAVIVSKPVVSTGGTATYSVEVAPTRATTYRVELVNPVSTTPAAQATPIDVYVTPGGTSRVSSNYGRPEDTVKVVFVAYDPPGTPSSDIYAHWYVYYSVNLSSASSEPAAPADLGLHPGVTVSGPTVVGPNQYQYSFSFSFNVGKGGYHYEEDQCQLDHEATDGLGLPGHHGCGDPTWYWSTYAG